MDKDNLIKKVYFDPSGYGSMANTLADARKKDKSITIDDVKAWFGKNIERKVGYKGYNSFIAEKPYEEFQADLFFITGEDLEYKVALLLVDAFSKYCVVIPLKSKLTLDVLQGFKDGIEKMKGKPATVYSDNEGAFVSNEVQKYFKDNNIRSLTTLTHAPIAERTIRTIKNMIDKRQDHDNKPWYDILFSVLLTYNNKLKHSSTKMTPVEARRPINTIAVKINLERLRHMDRKYPPLEAGDTVKYYRKKDKLDKERISTWSKNSYEIEDILEDRGQTFYKTTAPHHNKLYLRHELLKI